MDSYSFQGHGYTYETRLMNGILCSKVEPPIAELTASETQPSTYLLFGPKGRYIRGCNANEQKTKAVPQIL